MKLLILIENYNVIKYINANKILINSIKMYYFHLLQKKKEKTELSSSYRYYESIFHIEAIKNYKIDTTKDEDNVNKISLNSIQ